MVLSTHSIPVVDPYGVIYLVSLLRLQIFYTVSVAAQVAGNSSVLEVHEGQLLDLCKVPKEILLGESNRPIAFHVYIALGPEIEYVQGSTEAYFVPIFQKGLVTF